MWASAPGVCPSQCSIEDRPFPAACSWPDRARIASTRTPISNSSPQQHNSQRRNRVQSVKDRWIACARSRDLNRPGPECSQRNSPAAHCINTNRGESMTHCAMQHIPLSSAYLCQDCDCIGNCPSQCPACASSVLLNLSGILDREVELQQQPALAYPYPRAVVGTVAELPSLTSLVA